MNKFESSDPVASPDVSTMNERVLASVRSHQRKIRVLTGVAFLLGFLAVVASILIVAAYFVLYRPKEKEVLLRVTEAAQQARPTEGGAALAPKLPFDFPSVQATMTFFHSVVIMFLAGAVGLLALGTLVLLSVVMLSRRATLHQINEALMQMSALLKALPAAESRVK